MTDPAPLLPGGLDLRTALETQERHTPDLDGLRRHVLNRPLPHPGGADHRPRRRGRRAGALSVLSTVAAMIVATVVIVGVIRAQSTAAQHMYPRTDFLPCPSDGADYRPATNAPGADRLMVPGRPHTVGICTYDGGRLSGENQPYSADDPERPVVGAIAVELNQTTDVPCHSSSQVPSKIIRFGYPDGSAVDVLLRPGPHCTILDNGRLRTSAPESLLAAYEPPPCDAACWSRAGAFDTTSPTLNDATMTSTHPAMTSTHLPTPSGR